MPILTATGPLDATHRVVRAGGLEYNTDRTLICRQVGGWYSTPAPDAVLVANGGGPGVVAVGKWSPKERYYTLDGHVAAVPDRADGEALLRMVHASIPTEAETSLVVLGGLRDLQAFVRRYDAGTADLVGDRHYAFSIPLVAADPRKYALTPMAATAGGFTPSDWFRTYDNASGDYYRVYALDGSVQYRTYLDEDPGGTLNPVAALTSAGDVDSRRMTITVTGPLPAGGWWVEDADGTRLWANLTLAAGQSIVFDCFTRTATVNGSAVNHLVFGDYLQLAPGPNAFRLITDADDGAFMQIEALEAFR